MFKSEAGLFLSANNNVNSAKTLINECKRLIIDFDLEGNADSKSLKSNINNCDINGLVTKIENTKESLMKLDQGFASEYMTLLQKYIETSTIDTSNMSDEEKMQYSIKMDGYARDYNQNLLYMLEKYEESDMLTDEMKQQLKYQKELVAQYDIQDKMAVLDPTSDEYINLFKQNAEHDKNLINLNPSLTKEQKDSYLKEYETQYNKNLESLNTARDARVKRELDEKELQALYASKEDNNGFWHPFVESEIDEAILDKKIAMGIASEDEISYKNMNGWDRFWTDTGTFAASTFTGLFNITEGIGDSFVMLGSAVNIVDKDWASEYVKRDISGELYQGIELSNNMNTYSAYGTWHTAGEAFGEFVGKTGITFAAPWASAALYGLDAMGQSAETSFNNGDDYWKAFAKSTVSGIGGAVEGFGMSKLNLGVRNFMSSGSLKTIGGKVLTKVKSLPTTLSNAGSLKTIVSKGMKKTVNTIGTSFVSTILEPDAMIETGSVIFDNAIDGDDWTKTAKEAGAVFAINWGMNFATDLAFGSSAGKQKPKPNTSEKLSLDELSYKKVGPISSSYYMLESNIHKYSYVNTNAIDGLNDSIKQNGLYHFTSESACDKILESGYVKKSGYIASYGNKKSFFFNGIPDAGAYATNIDDLPLRTTAVKIMPDSNLLNSDALKIRNLDDMAITHDGNLTFSSDQASKEYFCLFKENDKLVYRNVTKEFYDNYPNTESGKLLGDFVSKKSNVNTIKNDFYYNLSTKLSGSKEIGGSFSSILNDNVAINPTTVSSYTVGNSLGKNYDLEVQNMNNARNISNEISTNTKLEADRLYRQNLENYQKIPGYDDYYVRQEVMRNNSNLNRARDVLNEWGMKQGKSNYAEQALRQYAETGSVYQTVNGKLAPYITSTAGVRAYIETLDPKVVAEYLDNRPLTSGSVENLNTFFRKSSSSYGDTYGVDQGGIKNLCEYSLNGQKYTYQQAKDIVNDAKNNGMPIPKFKKEGTKEYFALKDKLVSKGLTNSQASVILSSIDDIGACSYAAKANSIFYEFSANPDLFEEKFGFSMYKINSHGEKVLNSNELLLDMYLFANDTSNGGKLFTKDLYNNSYTFYESNSIDVFGRQMLDTKKQVYLSYNTGSNNYVLKNYLNSKGLDWDSYNLIENSPNNIVSNDEFSGYLYAVNESIKEGKAVQLNIFAKGSEIRMLNSNPNLSYTTRTWKEGGGHAVFVTGIGNDGFIVSSWGKEYLIPFSDLKNGGYFNIMIDDIN